LTCLKEAGLRRGNGRARDPDDEGNDQEGDGNQQDTSALRHGVSIQRSGPPPPTGAPTEHASQIGLTARTGGFLARRDERVKYARESWRSYAPELMDPGAGGVAIGSDGRARCWWCVGD